MVKKIISRTADKYLYDKDLKVIPRPNPIVNYMPSWWKKLQKDIQKPTKFGSRFNSTIKGCIPFQDTLTAGYTITASQDFYLRAWDNGSDELHWEAEYPMHYEVSKGWNLISDHPIAQVGDSFSKPKGKSIILKYCNFWGFETPPGYSLLYTPILNNYTLQNKGIHFLSGIVDHDQYSGVPVELPFIFNNTSPEGVIIERDTPLVQIIPIKKENWQMEYEVNERKHWTQHWMGMTVFRNTYRKFYWNKVRYK